MRFFFTYWRLELKRQLRDGAFWGCAALFAALVLGFAAVYPAPAPLSTSVGLLFDPARPIECEAAALLEQNEDYTFVSYPPDAREALRRDLLSGALHCAYLLDERDPTPVTVWETDGSLLRPIIDETVLSAWYTADIARQVERFFLSRGFSEGSAVAPAVAASNAALTLRFEAVGTAAPLPETGLSVAPLLYAVLISLFLLFVVLAALLSSGEERRVSALLTACLPTCRRSAARAPPLARAVLTAAVLLAVQAALLLFGVSASYSLGAQLALTLALTPCSALLAAAVARLRRFALPMLLLLPIGTAASVLFSGAILDPALLGGIGLLRFFSPAWW
ncbi:MAG: hypothetical protein RR197_06360, partial [Oscillospiraceae bacterium]